MPAPEPDKPLIEQKAWKLPLITTADATDLASALVLLNEIKAKLNAMNSA